VKQEQHILSGMPAKDKFESRHGMEWRRAQTPWSSRLIKLVYGVCAIHKIRVAGVPRASIHHPPFAEASRRSKAKSAWQGCHAPVGEDHVIQESSEYC